MKAHAVVFGSTGNQDYIFGSNKRRENVGASYLITCVEDVWLRRALKHHPDDMRTLRLDEHGMQVVTASAGGAVLLVREAAEGRRIVGAVTGSALREAPGLDVCGAVGEEFEFGAAETLARAVEAARDSLRTARLARRSPRLRFPGLPIADRCRSSGLPAHRVVKFGGKRPPEPRSAESLAKLDAFDAALLRLAGEMGMRDDLDEKAVRGRLADIVDYLGDQADWIAVVHADGNGMGKIFQEFADIATSRGQGSAAAYIEGFRALSDGMDDCARRAFREVVNGLRSLDIDRPEGKQWPAGEPPILPLVLGGDDLTVVCDGELALPFAHQYLEKFTEFADREASVGGVLRAAGRRGIGACAGVAIVKRNHPFHSAVRLADDLTKEAKAVKRQLGPDRSALSFHVLYETAHAELGRLRARQTPTGQVPRETSLTAQPYLIGAGDARPWARHRHWSDLLRRTAALGRVGIDPYRDDAGPDGDAVGSDVVSNTQAHELRAGLFRGREVADARFRSLTAWLGESAVRDLAADDGSLFWEDGDVLRTGLLDAMDAAPFLRTTDLPSQATEGSG